MSRLKNLAKDASSSESEEGEEQDNYELDDFVVPDNIEEEEPQHKSDKREKKSPRRSRIRKIDIDDLSLIEENLDLPSRTYPAEEDRSAGQDFERPPQKRAKTTEQSDSSDNDFIDKELEPGEIPEKSDHLSLAAMIFGAEVLDTPLRSTGGLIREPGAESQDEVFEPSELKENYATSEDQVIREVDMPERYQRRHKLIEEETSSFFDRDGPTEEELKQEAEWMYLRLHSSKQQYSEERLKEVLGLFLNLLRVERYEVPFIMLYRRHLLHPGIDDNREYWTFYRWDIEWAHHYSSTLQSAALLDRASRNTADQTRGRTLSKGERVLIRPEIPEEVQKLLHIGDASIENGQGWGRTGSSARNDLQRYLDVHTAQVQPDKMRFSTSFLVEARRNRLQEFVDKSGLSPRELGQNLERREVLNKPVTPKVRPQELAFDLISYAYTDEMKVISAACQLAKLELMTWPTFRQYVNKEYLKEVRIFTSPTIKGRTTLDVFHPLYRVKNLERGKSLISFGGELWGEALRCEQLGLIDISFKLAWSQLEDDRILSQMKPFYLGDQDNEFESDWNRFRGEVVSLAVTELYSELAKEVRKELTVKAEEFILDKAEEAFRAMISTAPIRTKEHEDRRIFALVTDPDAINFGQTALVVLDGNGEIVETQLLNTLTARKLDTMHEADRQRSLTERRTLQRLILEQHPRTIVLAANCTHVLQVRKLIFDLSKVLTLADFDESAVDWQVDRSMLLKESPSVMMVDPQVAKVFAVSARSKRMLPNCNTYLRQAASLGRFVQNPLAEVLGLWADPNEDSILQLKLHSLQKVVPGRQLLQRLECVAVEISCFCGAEINRMVAHPHLRPPLSFISGLGHVKAHSLVEAVNKAGGKLNFRYELPGNKMMGRQVYENSAGFIIIRNTDGSEDPLDHTRIHPECYELAAKVAASAIDVQKHDETIVQVAMSKPNLAELIESLDLELYAQHLESKGMKNLIEVLEFICQELVRPFAVDLQELKDLEAKQLLYLCSGESPDSLKKGSVVQAIVIGYDDKHSRLRCRLESGLEAFAESTEMPDGTNPAELRKGTTVTARVLEVGGVTYESKDVVFRVRLSLKVDDLATHDRFVRWELDDAFVRDDADWMDMMRMEDGTSEVLKYVPRVVNHPRYRNVSLATACEELAKQDIGDCLFRPSSRGQDHLTCTFKFYDFVFGHLDIIEEGKPAVNMLGTRFRISTETYESLQEILERYINPVAKLTREVLGHPKFKDCMRGGVEFIESSLRSEKRTQQSAIPYNFTILPQYPQFFMLNSLPKDRIVREFIKVKPKGLFFHEAYHPSINFLISWFKQHCNDKNYHSQLARSKAPFMETKAAKAADQPITPSQADIAPPTPQAEYRPKPQSATETPFNRTPHIGHQEWAGGQQLSSTPRADDWYMSRTYDTEDRPQKADADWGAQSRTSGDWGSHTGKSDWGGDFARPASPKGGRSSRGSRGGRGRGGNTREGGGRGSGCHNCGQEGHFARECPNKSTRPPIKCFKCNEEGHMSRDCPNSDSAPSRRPRDDQGSKGSESWGQKETAGSWGASNSTWGVTTEPISWGAQSSWGKPSSSWGVTTEPSSGGAQSSWGKPSSSWGVTTEPNSGGAQSSWGNPSSSWGQPPEAPGQSRSWGQSSDSAPSSTWGAPSSAWGQPPEAPSISSDSAPSSTWGAPSSAWGQPPEAPSISSDSAPSSTWGAPSSAWGQPPEAPGQSSDSAPSATWGAPSSEATEAWGQPPQPAAWGQPAENTSSTEPAESPSKTSEWGQPSSWGK
jgi:transcription elongation factor SPT6